MIQGDISQMCFSKSFILFRNIQAVYCSEEIIAHDFMYTGFKVNTSIIKSTVSGLNQTHLQSLQREVDTYTRKLESQKRKYFAFQDQHRAVTDQYTKQKEKLNLLKKQNTKPESIILQAKLKNLEANLDKAISAYDDTVAYNNRLKAEIDMLRREKKNYIQMQRVLEEQLRKVDEQATEKMETLNKKKKKAEDLKQEIIETKTKNEQERESYFSKFSSLEKQYLGDKNSTDMSMSKLKNNELLGFNSDSKPQIVDTQPLLKFRLKRIITSNKQKLRLIEQYKKHMMLIEEAFDQIRQKSSITDLDQITATFIKSEEQNYSLYNYMDSLTQSIDQIEEENKELESQIQKKTIQDQLKRQGLNTKKHLANNLSLTQLQSKDTGIDQNLKINEKSTHDLLTLVSKIKPALESTLIELASSGLLNAVQSQKSMLKNSKELKINLNITDRNVEEYLSQLEKHINLLLVAKKQAQTKTITQIKEAATGYSKPIPIVNYEDLVKEKERVERTDKDETKFWQENRFRQYAKQFWEKKKGNGLKGLNMETNQQLGRGQLGQNNGRDNNPSFKEEKDSGL